MNRDLEHEEEPGVARAASPGEGRGRQSRPGRAEPQQGRAHVQQERRQGQDMRSQEGRARSPPHSPWGFTRGSSSVQTSWVPKKFVFIVTSA